MIIHGRAGRAIRPSAWSRGLEITGPVFSPRRRLCFSSQRPVTSQDRRDQSDGADGLSPGWGHLRDLRSVPGVAAPGRTPPASSTTTTSAPVATTAAPVRPQRRSLPDHLAFLRRFQRLGWRCGLRLLRRRGGAGSVAGLIVAQRPQSHPASPLRMSPFLPGGGSSNVKDDQPPNGSDTWWVPAPTWADFDPTVIVAVAPTGIVASTASRPPISVQLVDTGPRAVSR